MLACMPREIDRWPGFADFQVPSSNEHATIPRGQDGSPLEAIFPHTTLYPMAIAQQCPGWVRPGRFAAGLRQVRSTATHSSRVTGDEPPHGLCLGESAALGTRSWGMQTSLVRHATGAVLAPPPCRLSVCRGHFALSFFSLGS